MTRPFNKRAHAQHLANGELRSELDRAVGIRKSSLDCLRWADELAAIRAIAAQHRSVLKSEDFLGAMWVTCGERTAKYWDDPEGFDHLVRDVCGMCEPRVFYWIQFYERRKKRRIWTEPRFILFGGPSRMTMWTESADLAAWREEAMDIAGRRASAVHCSSAVLTPEDYLMALARHPERELGRKLLESGLDLGSLQGALFASSAQPAGSNPGKPDSPPS